MAAISVLMPVYKCERFVAEAIESVLAQTHEDWELLISDNASPDGTWAVVQGYRDPRIKAVRQSENIGASRNWAAVFDMATSPYGAFLCGDDFYLPDFLERRLRLLQSDPSIIIAHGPAWVVNDGSERMHLSTMEAEGRWTTKDLLPRLLSSNVVNFISAAFPLNVLREHAIAIDPQFRIMADWAFWIDIASLEGVAVADEEVSCCYRMHASNITTNSRASYLWNYEALLVGLSRVKKFEGVLRAQGDDPEGILREKLRVAAAEWRRALLGCDFLTAGKFLRLYSRFGNPAFLLRDALPRSIYK